MEEQLAQHVVDVLKALAHPTRLQIVELLRKGEMSVNQIVRQLGAKQAATSQQLNLMKHIGVLTCRRHETKVYYRIANKNILKVLDRVQDYCTAKKGAKK